MSEHEQMLDMQARILEAIEKNTDAVIQLAEALAGVRAAKVAKVEATKAIEKAATTEPAAPAPVGEPAGETPAQSQEAAALDYKRDVAPTMAKLLAAKGAPFVVELLSQFGVKKGADLPADKLADALAAATAALGE